MDKILLKTLTTGKRKSYLVQCPDCNSTRPMRSDSYKNAATTCCRSCLNLRRPTKDPEDKFNYMEFYRSPRGKASHIYSFQVDKSKARNHEPPKYTREELIDFLLNSEIYLTLFNQWKESGYLRDLAPSVDRLDDYETYSFDNIQVITWAENNKKYQEDVKNGKTTKVCRSVVQMDLEGNVIKEFYSVMQAQRETGIRNSHIIDVCRGRRSRTGNFLWRYA